MIRAVLDEEEDVERVTFIGSQRTEDGVAGVVNAIREAVPVELDEFRAQGSPAEAFALLRNGIEQMGVYVLRIGDLGSYHTAIDLQTFRGFALADDVAPFIVINDRDAKSAWSFTLMHELTHLFLGQTGVSGQDSGLAIERFCNDVASEYLLPHAELAVLAPLPVGSAEALQATISDFAADRNISSSMVVYRLHRAGLLDQYQWQQLRQAFRNHWVQSQADRRERARTQDGGPSYYVVKRHRLGTALIESVRRMLRGGDLTTSKAGKVLGVKPQQVQTLVEAGPANRPRSAVLGMVDPQGNEGLAKVPLEMYEEIKSGNDKLAEWIKQPETKEALLLDVEADADSVSSVVVNGYAADLTDDDVEKIGRDPFLISYALNDPAAHCIVTTEVSKPGRTRANRHIPDVCSDVGVHSCDTFTFIRELDFRTDWDSR